MEKKTGKQTFIIPNANLYTDESRYMEECMKVAGREFPRSQALAICYSNWKNRTRI
jgi:hypothetical protein